MKRLVCGLTLILCGLGALPVFAQSQSDPSGGPVGSFGDLWAKVKSGDRISVLDRSAREVTGILQEASDSSIRVLVDGQIREIPVGDVRRVSRRGDPLWNGALIGAGLGAIAGAVDPDPVCPAGGDSLKGGCVATARDRAVSSLQVAVGMAAIGAGIDALFHRGKVVYEARSRAPIGLDGGAQGTRVRVTAPGTAHPRLTGNILTVDETTLTVIDQGGQHVNIPRERVTRLDVSSDRNAMPCGGFSSVPRSEALSLPRRWRRMMAVVVTAIVCPQPS
jgi:hypothetical protein